VVCSEQKRSEGDRQPRELCTRQDPTLAQRVAEREREFVVPAIITDTRRGGGRGSRGGRGRGSSAPENAADQGARGTRRGRGRGLGKSWRSWSQKPPRNPQMKKWKRWRKH